MGFPAFLFQYKAGRTTRPLDARGKLSQGAFLRGTMLDAFGKIPEEDPKKRLRLPSQLRQRLLSSERPPQLEFPRMRRILNLYADISKRFESIIRQLSESSQEQLAVTINAVAKRSGLKQRLSPATTMKFNETEKRSYYFFINKLLNNRRNVTTQQARNIAKAQLAVIGNVREPEKIVKLKRISQMTDGRIQDILKVFYDRLPKLIGKVDGKTPPSEIRRLANETIDKGSVSEDNKDYVLDVAKMSDAEIENIFNYHIRVPEYVPMQIPGEVQRFIFQILGNRKMTNSDEFGAHLSKVLAEREHIQAAARLPDDELLRQLRVHGVLPSAKKQI